MTRIAVAATLTFALLSALMPLGALTAEEMCSMTCCAGLAPHPAHACSGGACHIRLSSFTKTTTQKQPESLCGVDSILSGRHSVHSFFNSQTSETRTEQSSATSRMFMPPCAPGCGANGGGFSSQQFLRDPAALVYARYALPPNRTTLCSNAETLHNYLSFLARPARPRPPPFVLS